MHMRWVWLEGFHEMVKTRILISLFDEVIKTFYKKNYLFELGSSEFRGRKLRVKTATILWVEEPIRGEEKAVGIFFRQSPMTLLAFQSNYRISSILSFSRATMVDCYMKCFGQK